MEDQKTQLENDYAMLNAAQVLAEKIGALRQEIAAKTEDLKRLTIQRVELLKRLELLVLGRPPQ